VAVADDATSEPSESLALNLSSATNATITDGRGLAVIGASDAGATATPAISAPADVVVGEGDGFLDLVVSLSAPGVDPVSVNFAAANSTASAGVACNGDYVDVGGTLNFAPGETTKVVRIDILDCADVEGLQSFTLGLSVAVNATIARASARISIEQSAVADFDGDRDTEIGIFRPSSGLWALRGLDWANFGGSGDIPVPADYDGDGDDDIAIFKPSTGLWAIRGQNWASFGGSGDIPLPLRPALHSHFGL
jgi:hypothetical protein